MKKMKKSAKEIAQDVMREFNLIQQNEHVIMMQIWHDDLKLYANRRCGNLFMNKVSQRLKEAFDRHEYEDSDITYVITNDDNDLIITVCMLDLLTMLRLAETPIKINVGIFTEIISCG